LLLLFFPYGVTDLIHLSVQLGDFLSYGNIILGLILGGVIAAFTTLPVIGVPIKSSTMDGLDSLLSMVQMPKGIPVATVAIDGADNAAILAAQILALKYENIASMLDEFKKQMADEVMTKNERIMLEAQAL